MRRWRAVELMRSDSNGGSLSRSSNHHGDRLHQNSQIHPQTPVLDVFQIKIQSGLKGSAPSRHHLPQPRDSRHDVQTPQVIELVTREVIHWVRSWTDQAHLSFQHIPKLWKFIEAVSSQPLP